MEDERLPLFVGVDTIKRDLGVSRSKAYEIIKELNRDLIAENIKLDWILEVAKRHGDSEVTMANEIYDVICDMVCYPRKHVMIKETKYPWNTVKSQFLKLRYEHITAILNRIVDADLRIKNMQAYLISTLYSASLVGTIEAEASIHVDYLKYLRGEPYVILIRFWGWIPAIAVPIGCAWAVVDRS